MNIKKRKVNEQTLTEQIKGDDFIPRKYTFSIYSVRCRPTSLLQCKNILHDVAVRKNVLCFPFSVLQALTCVYKY